MNRYTFSDEIIRRHIEALSSESQAGMVGSRMAVAWGEEILRLRAELARLKPLADAAVALNTQHIGKLDTTVGDVWELIKTARVYAAQAQDGGK